jgi:hypothetical protein
MKSKWCVDALVPMTYKIKQMQLVFQVCDDAKIPVPDVVVDFFRDHKVSPYNNTTGIGEVRLFAHGFVDQVHESVSVIGDTDTEDEGYMIDLSKLPKGTEKLRITIV